MNSRAIWGVAVAVLLSASLIGSAFAVGHPGWLTVSTDVVLEKNKNTSLLGIISPLTIPKHTDTFGGFGWPTAGGNVFAATTHDGARDSHQNPNGWHTHVVTTGGGGCITAITDNTNSGISLSGNTMAIQVRNSQLDGGIEGGTAFAFLIVSDGACDSGLKVVGV